MSVKARLKVTVVEDGQVSISVKHLKGVNVNAKTMSPTQEGAMRFFSFLEDITTAYNKSITDFNKKQEEATEDGEVKNVVAKDSVV